MGLRIETDLDFETIAWCIFDDGDPEQSHGTTRVAEPVFAFAV